MGWRSQHECAGTDSEERVFNVLGLLVLLVLAVV